MMDTEDALRVALFRRGLRARNTGVPEPAPTLDQVRAALPEPVSDDAWHVAVDAAIARESSIG